METNKEQPKHLEFLLEDDFETLLIKSYCRSRRLTLPDKFEELKKLGIRSDEFRYSYYFDEATSWAVKSRKNFSEEDFRVIAHINSLHEPFTASHNNFLEKFLRILDNSELFAKKVTDGVAFDDIAGIKDLLGDTLSSLFLSKWLDAHYLRTGKDMRELEDDVFVCLASETPASTYYPSFFTSWIKAKGLDKDSALRIFSDIAKNNAEAAADFIIQWINHEESLPVDDAFFGLAMGQRTANPIEFDVEDVCRLMTVGGYSIGKFVIEWAEKESLAGRDHFATLIGSKAAGNGIITNLSAWKFDPKKIKEEGFDEDNFLYAVSKLSFNPKLIPNSVVQKVVDCCDLSSDQVLAMAKQEVLKDKKADFISACLDSKNFCKKIDRNFIFKVLDFIENDEEKNKVIESWIRNFKDFSQEDFIVLVNNPGFSLNMWGYKLDFIKDELSAEKIKEIAGKIEDKENRLEFITRSSYYLAKSSAHNLQKLVLEVFNEDPPLLDKYDPESVKKAFSSVKNSDLVGLIKDLYPTNEYLQMAYVEHYSALKCPRISKNQFLGFIGGLENDDIVLDAISPESYYAYWLGREKLTDKEIRDVANNRMHSRYKSLSSVFEGKMAKDFLTPEALEEARKTFDDIDNISLSSLMSFYDIKNQFVDFIAMLKPEILEEVRGKGKFKSSKCYLTPVESGKLEILLGVKLPKAEGLCDLIEESRGKVPPVDFDSYYINFGSVKESYAEDKMADLNSKFREILKSKNPSPEEVAKFFKDLLLIEGDISGDNAVKLCDAVSSNKEEFALIFSQDDGVEKLRNLITTLGDGCIANIGSHISIALNKILIADPDVRILYSAFADGVIGPFLSQGDDKLDHDKKNKFDVLKSRGLKDCSLVPEQFMLAVSHCFVGKSGEQLIEPWGFFKDRGSVLSSDYADCCVNFFVESFGDNLNNFNKLSAKFVTMSILEKKMPELFRHEDLEESRKWYFEMRKGIAQMMEAERKGEVEELDYKVASDDAGRIAAPMPAAPSFADKDKKGFAEDFRAKVRNARDEELQNERREPVLAAFKLPKLSEIAQRYKTPAASPTLAKKQRDPWVGSEYPAPSISHQGAQISDDRQKKDMIEFEKTAKMEKSPKTRAR